MCMVHPMVWFLFCWSSVGCVARIVCMELSIYSAVVGCLVDWCIGALVCMSYSMVRVVVILID